jgi:hypothetical protein
MTLSEFLQQRLRKLTKDAQRTRARPRTRCCGAQPRSPRPTARPARRYRGIRNNLFDVRRTAAVQNLETVHRRVIANDNYQWSAA